MRRSSRRAAQFNSCSKEDCGKALDFKQAKVCIFCKGGFCDDCLAFNGEFRSTDFICPVCMKEIDNEVIIVAKGQAPGSKVTKDLGVVVSMKGRTPEATEFFLKWMAMSRGANAILECSLQQPEDNSKTTGQARAALIENK